MHQGNPKTTCVRQNLPDDSRPTYLPRARLTSRIRLILVHKSQLSAQALHEAQDMPASTAVKNFGLPLTAT